MKKRGIKYSQASRSPGLIARTGREEDEQVKGCLDKLDMWDCVGCLGGH